MSLADIVVSLHDLRVKRVVTTYEFRTCQDYVHRVEILIENKSTRDCWVVPSVFYDKKVLVAFSAEDAHGDKAILTPSGRNDELLCRLLFYHSWLKATDEQRNLLYKVFVNPGADSPSDVEAILNQEEFQGQLHAELRKSMWSDPTPIADLLRTHLINKLQDEEKSKFEDQKDLSLENLCGADYVEFFEKLDAKFFQLIWLQQPIKSNQYQTIVGEDQRFTTKTISRSQDARLQRRGWGFAGSRCTLPIEVQPATPLHSGAAFHLRIIPPDGVKLDLETSGLAKTIHCSRLIYSNEETVIDRGKMDFFHIESGGEPCAHLSNSLGLESFQSKPQRLSNELSRYLKKSHVPDVRTRFEANWMMMYFTPSPGESKICPDSQNHFLSFRLDLQSQFSRVIQWAIIGFLIWTLAATYFLLPQKFLALTLANGYAIKPDWLLLIDNYFWSIITLMIGESLGVLLDYSGRPESQQYFLFNTTLLIISLTMMEFALVLIGPLVIASGLIWEAVGFFIVALVLMAFLTVSKK